MKHETVYLDLGPDPFSPEGKALIWMGLWMRAGFVGASLFAIGAITLFTGDASAGLALALIAVGGALAYFAWRRSLQHIERIDPEASPLAARRAASGDRMAMAVANRRPSTAPSIASNSIPLLPFGS